MKKAIAIILAGAAMLLSVNNASAQDKWVFNHLGVGVSAGLDGFGADLVLPLTPFIQVRGGYAMQPLTYDVKTMHVSMSKADGAPWNLDQDVTATISANLDAAHLFIDLYPGKKAGIHFTVGAYYGMHPENGGPYRIGTKEPLQIDETDKGRTGIELTEHEEFSQLTTDPEGNLFLDLGLENPLAGKINMPANLYPYVGIGFGRNLSSKRLALTMDLGAIYTGRLGFCGYDYSQNVVAGGDVKTVPINAADFAALSSLNVPENIIEMVQKYYGKAESCPVTPVLKFNLVFRLF